LVSKGSYPDFPAALRHTTFNLVSIAVDSGLTPRTLPVADIRADVDDVLELYRCQLRFHRRAASR